MFVSFRIAKKEDIKDIIDLCNECFFENTSYEYANKVFDENVDDPNSIYLVGEIMEKLFHIQRYQLFELFMKI